MSEPSRENIKAYKEISGLLFLLVLVVLAPIGMGTMFGAGFGWMTLLLAVIVLICAFDTLAKKESLDLAKKELRDQNEESVEGNQN